MTVRELIESLSKIEDQDIRVMVKGYEGGVDDIVIGNGIDNSTTVIPAIQYVALNVNEEWYIGRHERVEDIDRDTIKDYQIVKAVII
jgi:hypothetical protein